MRTATWILVGTLVGAVLASAAENVGDTAGLLQGVSAKPLERREPVYPRQLRDRGYEGFVIVSFIVKADGSTGDAIVEDSTGPFEESALEAVRTWRYEPATFGGKPVDQAYTSVAIVFRMSEPTPPSGRFLGKYRELRRQLNDNQLDEAERQIRVLSEGDRVSLNEHVYLALAEAVLRAKQKNPVAELRSLRRAVINDGVGLEPEAYTSALDSIFRLEVEQQSLRAALKTYTKLEARKGDPAPEIVEVVGKIREKAASPALLGRKGRIPTPEEIAAGQAPRRWSHNLLRNEMGLQDVTGTLESVELRCSYHRVVDTQLPADKTWKIPQSWGDDCFVYVTGAPGTTFTLIEYPAEPAPAS